MGGATNNLKNYETYQAAPTAGNDVAAGAEGADHEVKGADREGEPVDGGVGGSKCAHADGDGED